MTGARPAVATAFAPATVANVAVGFDLLGFAISGFGDTVTVRRIEEPTVRIVSSTWSPALAGAASRGTFPAPVGAVGRESGGGTGDGLPAGLPGAAGRPTPGGEAAPPLPGGPVSGRPATPGLLEPLPLDAAKNTAGVVLIGLREKLGLSFGFAVEVVKGIPLGSGMGGSAASAVGALVAANALLERPLPQPDLFTLSLLGETLAGGAPHGDNVGPCLCGGLLLARRVSPPDLLPLPVLPELRAVVVHPHLRVDTKAARAILKPAVPMAGFIAQTANLAGFVTACHTGDYDLLGRSLEDVVIEPQRAVLIPGFATAKAAAPAAGALGFSISGSGPSVFALARGDAAAERVRAAVRAVFADQALPCDEWVGPISPRGAHLVGPGKPQAG
ncbi:MAG: homoserine kinase [Candidatus Riflebacteria bacterium]|nr:homoserine kinase [Candidatus Riflebacteria bacterium]